MEKERHAKKSNIPSVVSMIFIIIFVAIIAISAYILVPKANHLIEHANDTLTNIDVILSDTGQVITNISEVDIHDAIADGIHGTVTSDDIVRTFIESYGVWAD